MDPLKKLLLAGISFILISGCQSKVLESEKFFENARPVEYETVKQAAGFNADIEDQNLVIRDFPRFKEVWLSLHGRDVGVSEIPEIDFDTKMVLVTVMGNKSTGGYTSEITRVGFFNNKVGVDVKNRIPGPDCGTIQALTTPYHIVKLEKSEQPVTFFEKTVTKNCN